MLRMIGLVLLFIFMLLTGFAALMDLLRKSGKESKGIIITDILSILAGISPLTFFVLNYKTFFIVIVIANLMIIFCSIMNGVLNKNFHLSHHVVRMVIVLILLILVLP